MERVFQALASTPRRKILAYLAHAELSAGDIASRFAMSKPAVSQHLRVLKEAGLVRERRQGTRNFYSVNGPAFYYAKYPIRVRRSQTVRIYLANLTEFGSTLLFLSSQ